MIPKRMLTSFRAARHAGRLLPRAVERFQGMVLDYYREHRRPFPWRATRDPYHIVVAEIMLQQTQTDRVATKFVEFVDAFPSFEALAVAPFDEVLRVWQGMGYNRRAKSLQGIAHKVTREFGGRLPRNVDTLKTFPGIGPHTAASIAAYAFNKPAVFIETNIRTVYIHAFFDDDALVHDDDLYPLVEQTLYRNDPNRWYNALMDFGTALKGEIGNVNRRSRHYVRQSPFEGSNRQIRSMIVKTLLAEPGCAPRRIAMLIDRPVESVRENLGRLAREGLVAVRNGRFVIA